MRCASAHQNTSDLRAQCENSNDPKQMLTLALLASATEYLRERK